MKKLINITHTDLDGVGCTAICQYFADKNGYEVEFFNCGYSTVNDRVREVIDRVEAGEKIDMVLPPYQGLPQSFCLTEHLCLYPL